MELRFQADADDWVKGLCVDFSTRVKILGLKLVGREREVAHFIDIATETDSHEGVREWLDASPVVKSSELTELSRRRMVGVVVADHCRACASIVGANLAAFVSSATTGEDCTVSYKVFLGNEGVPSLLSRLSKDRVSYRVRDVGPLSPDRKLTERQLGVLKSAMEMGLYDFPRRITLVELAEKLGIKGSTLSETLRAAEKSVLGRFLGEVETEG